MGLETYFRIFAIDNTGKRKKTKEWIHETWKEELKHDCYGSSMPTVDREEQIEREGIPPFIKIRKDATANCIKYNYLPDQECDPFPLWVDAASGNIAYELMEENFLSDFDELYKHLNLDSNSHKCCEITADDARKMAAVLDYILKGKYDRDIEDAVFEDNEYFRLFEEQFFNFGMRFRNKKKKSLQQTIRIIIKDDRHDVQREDSYDEEEDDWELIEERRESEKNERRTIQRLRDVLTTFLILLPPDYVKNPPVVYKLGYFLSY